MKFPFFFLGRKKHRQNSQARVPLFLFNTYANKKDVFTPRDERIVKMYNCGPTVYDYQHIGNLRAFVFTDILKRVLLYNGFPTKQVMNITDVGHLTGENEGDPDTGEDKMEKGAEKAGMSAKKLATKITRAFKEDLEKLNIKTESIIFTKATDFIKEQIALIETLEERGYTYKINDGVYFDTSKFPDYGKLGNINIEALKEGARVEANKEKKNPTDFALWKFSTSTAKREQEWSSPWGVGFPGWHLECTSMIFAELGRQIDIHTGGIEHIPIHHNNEIAQAEAVTKKQYVKYWLHNAHITIEGQKISKSIGNTVYLRNIKDRGLTPLAYRYLLLTSHYKTHVNFTWDALKAAETAFSRLIQFFVDELGSKNGTINTEYKKRFHSHINDDLDTAGALAVLWELVRDENVANPDKRVTLLDFDKVLGLGLIEGHRKLKGMLGDMKKKVAISKIPDEVQKLVREREEARSTKEWEKADKLRANIEAKGYKIIDAESGPEIQKVE